MAVASLYMAVAGLLAGLELVVRLVLVLVHVLQSQGQREWMRKNGVDHNIKALGDADRKVCVLCSSRSLIDTLLNV